MDIIGSIIVIVGEMSSFRGKLPEICKFIFCCNSNHFACFIPLPKQRNFENSNLKEKRERDRGWGDREEMETVNKAKMPRCQDSLTARGTHKQYDVTIES